MFGKMMNNYYYGKSGKGDFRKEDMPETRMQLFRDTLRTRLAGLFRLNLIYMLIWIPAMIVILLSVSNVYNSLNAYFMVHENDYATYSEALKDAGSEVPISEADYNELKAQNADLGRFLQASLTTMLLWLFPCIAITGPFTAGITYVTRNWARDEHAFMWSDFKDAMKDNWKYSLAISTITGLLPLAAYEGWLFYGDMAASNAILIVPQVLVVLIGLIWSLSVTYMHPLTVTYELKLKDVIRNALILGVGRLPMSVGIRLLHCVPMLIAAAAVWFFGLDIILGMIILGAYYVLIGFGLSRFITASYTNAVFDRFINSRIEGAKVNQGLKEEDDDEEDEEDSEPAESEKPKTDQLTEGME